MKGKFWRSAVSVLLVIAILMSFSSCLSSGDDNTSDTDDSDSPVVVDNVVISDSFVELKINEIDTKEIQTVELSVEELNIHTIDEIEIKTVEIATVTMNDEFVYLAYQNFLSCYGEDVNIQKLLIDAAIGATCVIVIVGLSYCGGPVGTYFGAIITSELSKAAIIIGAAIDAAISGYQAYQEGGDFEYICGHMLNGIVEGFAWSALLAPATGIVSGVKALKAVKAVQKIPGMEKLTHDAARAVIQDLEKIIKQSGKIAADASDTAIKQLYKSAASELSSEITEDIFMSVVKNQAALVSIAKKLNPFGISKNIGKALKEQFCARAGLSDDAAKLFIKNIQNGSIKSINGIQDPVVKEYVEKNLTSFVGSFGSSISNDFLDECMKESFSDDVFTIIKQSVTTNHLYTDLVKKFGKESTDQLLDNANNLLLLQLRYGNDNVIELLTMKRLYSQLLKDNKIADSTIQQVLNGILDGGIKSLDEIETISRQVAVNIQSSREAVASLIKQLGLEKKSASLLNDIAAKELTRCSENVISSNAAIDIVSNGLGKSDIISKYGIAVYNSLTGNASQSITALSMKSNVNRDLLSDVLTDYLSASGLESEKIALILKGASTEFWNLSDKELLDIGPSVLRYYKGLNSEATHQFVADLAAKRSDFISEFLVKFTNDGNSIRNGKYAGQLLTPAGDYADLVKAKYGDIFMSNAGFPIFDEHAIATIQSDLLTGVNSGADDIALANKLHHGTTATPPGYTWHHLEDGRTMILIPTDLHEAYRHTGGADLLREGLKGAVYG